VIDLRRLDLNLLTIFEAVYEHGSVARAAANLRLSDSATSHALARLREACGDPLFVRRGQGLGPTPAAARLFPEVKGALETLRRSLAEARGFDPAHSARRFALAFPHPMGPLWALDLRDATQAAAPGVALTFDTQTLPADVPARLRAGALDLAVDWMPARDPRLVQRPLFEDRILFIARPGHPRACWEMDGPALRRERFVSVHPRPGPRSDALEGAARTINALDLDWVIRVSEFLEVPYLVATTDLLGYLPASLARPALEAGLVREVPLPVALPPIPIFLIWHETRRTDEGHRWLRHLVARRVASAVAAVLQETDAAAE
jgi:DNA-binding transcriptional LysR family regulator